MDTKSIVDFIEDNGIADTNMQSRAAALMKPMESDAMDLAHIALGIAGEAGEVADAIKKAIIYNKELDLENIVEELGDLKFYIAALQNKLVISSSTIDNYNANKLAKRYPEGYTDAAAQARADKQ